ncbi:NrfD/PsrC family molybdoenzyme membrane anchor subunit [Thermoproteota archaeon]
MSDKIEKLLRPIKYTSREFYPFVLFLIAVSLGAIYAYIQQLSQGLGVTGLNDVTFWGVYIVNFIFFIGISHAGIAISAAVRLLNSETYKPIARIAELLTIVSLVMAGFSIVIDLGRPDRSFLLITKYLLRFRESPLIWDITAVGTYLVLSSTYLYLTLRRDFKITSERVEGWRKTFYELLIPAYQEDEHSTINRLSFWLSVTILPVMVMVHTTVAWIFALLGSRPLWFTAFAGPYYIIAAIASGISSVVVIAAIMRRIYHWEDILEPMIFKGLANVSMFTTLIYLYMMLAEQIGALYAGPEAEFLVSYEWIFGSFSNIFWGMTTIGLIIPFLFLLWQAFKKGFVHIEGSAVMCAILVIAFWFKRFMIIVPTLSIGVQKVGIYIPTWVELAILFGAFAIPILLYTLLSKIVPLIELEEH